MRMPRISREFWSRCPACAANERAQQEAEDSAAQTRRKQQALQVAIGQAGVPERFQTRSFENFVADTPEKQRALAVSRRYADTFADSLKSGRGLVFLGQPGTGKSHLAAAILMSMVQRHAVLYTTCMRMIRTVRDTWRRDSERSEREVLNMLSVEVDLLVIDEVGVQYGTDGEKTILFEVLDRRYSELRPTILLTNQDAAGLTEAVGDRIADRLRESSAFVLFQWPSYRGTAARQP
jgi:DNA replication protein DnaC